MTQCHPCAPLWADGAARYRSYVPTIFVLDCTALSNSSNCVLHALRQQVRQQAIEGLYGTPLYA